MRHPFRRLPVLVAALATTVVPLRAQEAPSETEALLEAIMTAARPGPEHGRLAGLEGIWSVETRLWYGRGAEPEVLRGTAESRMMLDGRFLVTESVVGEGEENEIRTLFLLGFDRRWDEYTIHLCDTLGTYCVDGRAPVGAPRDDVVLSGREPDPIARHTQIYDIVLHVEDDDTWTTTILFHDAAHRAEEEGPRKAMETRYTRSR